MIGGINIPQETENWGELTPKAKQKVERTTVEETRSLTQRTIAIWTAGAYFILIGLPLFFLPFGWIEVEGAVELIKTIAAVLGGVVGMVWIFYFKEK